MTDIPTSEDRTVKARRPFWRRAFAFWLRWTYRLVCGTTILAALLVGVAQTDAFRQWLRSIVIEQLDAALVGTLVFDDVRVDVFKGISIVHPVLYANGTTVLDAGSVSVTYDLAPLLRNVIAVNTVQISDAKINILRSKRDGIWNVTKIVKPPVDTTTSEPPDLHVYVRNVSITNATIVVNDETVPWGDGRFFDPLHLSMRNFELSATARMALRDRDYAVAINSMSFVETTSPLTVTNFSLAAHVNRAGVNVQTVHIVMPGTDVYARARIANIDVFNGFTDDSLQTHPLEGQIDADVVDAQHVHFFVPDVDIVGSYAVDANVSFFGDAIDVRGLHLTSDNIDLHGDANVQNLSLKRPLAVNIKAYNSRASYADVRRRLRFVPLPELPFLRQSQIDHVWLRGEPDDSLWFEVHASDAPGRVDGTMSLYLNEPTLGYAVDMDLRDGDLHAFDADSSAQHSGVNGHVRMRGRGVTLADLEGTTQIDLTASTVFNTPIRSLHATITGDGHGTISLDSLGLFFPVFGKGQGGERVDDLSEQRSLHVNGTILAADTARYGYDLSLDASALDLASVLGSESLPTRLSTSLHLRGSGLALDSIEAELTGTTTELVLADRAMLPFSTSASITRRGNERSVVFTAVSRFTKRPIIDLRIAGAFTPSALLYGLEATATTGVDLVLHSIRHVIDPTATIRTFRHEIAPMRARFDLVAEDVSPLAVLIPDAQVMFTGVIHGTCASAYGGFDLDVDTAMIRDLRIAVDSTVLIADPISINAHVRMSMLHATPALDSFAVQTSCDSVLAIGSTLLRRPSISVNMQGGRGRISCSSAINSMAAVLEAHYTVDEEQLSIEVDTASYTLDAVRGLRWNTTQPSTISFNNSVMSVHGLTIQRPFGETITISGLASEKMFGNMNVMVENFNVRDIPKFAPATASGPVALLRGLVTKATVTVNGEWDTPSIAFQCNAEDVSYNGEKIGALSMQLNHEDKTVTGWAKITQADSAKVADALDLQVRALPLDLSFRPVTQRLIDGRPIDMQANANKLSMAVVEPFLPAIEQLKGQADAMIKVQGTIPNDVSFSGNARFKNARFIASSTGLGYSASGALRLKGEQLIIDTVIVRNQPRDLLRKDNRGMGIASGTVTFDGLQVESVDFTMRTPGITVMTMQSVTRSPDIYGDVVIASGANPLHFYGKLTQPHLDGDVKVLYGDIVFPQERSTTKRRVTSFTYISPDDSLNRFYPSLIDRVKPRPSQDSLTQTIDSALASRALQSVVKAPSASFLDLLQFNLNVYIQGRFLITMNLGLAEILIADMELADPKIPLEYTGSFGTQTNLKGRMRLKEGTSTYKFFKPFTASGDLDFSAGGLTNPSLKLKAVYYGNRMVPAKGGGNPVREDYRVQIDISGTKQSPDAKFRLFRNDKEVVSADTNYVKSDCLMLILLNRTQEDLANSGQGNVVGELNASVSALATSALGDLIAGGGGFVQNAQLDVGSDLSQSKLTLSGQLFGNVTYRWSGTVSDISGNNNFTVTVPLSVINNADALKYFQMDFSRAVSNTGNITRYQKDWEIKVGARLP